MNLEPFDHNVFLMWKKYTVFILSELARFCAEMPFVSRVLTQAHLYKVID